MRKAPLRRPLFDMDKKGVLYIGKIASLGWIKPGERQLKVPKSYVRELVKNASSHKIDRSSRDNSIFKSWNFESIPLETRAIGDITNEGGSTPDFRTWKNHGEGEIVANHENIDLVANQENMELELAPKKADDDLNLAYKGKGKPYFCDLPMHFSISHTENRNGEKSFYLWGCAVSDLEVGLDFQWVRPARYMKIAKRHFTENEIGYVEKNGIDGFFALWTRREAVGKAVGIGLAMDKTDFPGTVASDGNLAIHINALGSHLEIHTACITENLWGSCCFVVGKED